MVKVVKCKTHKNKLSIKNTENIGLLFTVDENIFKNIGNIGLLFTVDANFLLNFSSSVFMYTKL